MIKSVKAAVCAGVAVVLAVLTAGAAPALSTTAHHAASHRSVCDTGQRGQKAYDRLCLHTGTVGDAAWLWYSTPEGHKGHVHDDYMTRRSICTYAPRHGGVKAAAVELVTDMTYDSYRNNKAVNAWVASVAVTNCREMGYRV